jgi:hypothetical protein
MNTLESALESLNGRIDASILTEDSRTISKSEMSAIRKYTRREVDEASVYTFPVLAIDTRPTRNGVIYSAESQKATCKKWIGIPFLFNSNAQGAGIFANGQDHTVQAASQFGRIYKSQLVETGNGQIGTLVWVYSFPDVSPAVQEFCNKVDTGILREVSIHVLAKNGVECSICGESFSADNHTHVPGEKYGKETCYIQTVGQLEPIELSSVACPGSTVAHIMDDADVSKYKLLSLREALRGSHSPIEATMSENVTEDDNKPLAESTAVVETQAAKTEEDDENKEKKSKKTEPDEPDSGESKPKEYDDSPDNKTGKKVGKQSLNLFEGTDACPVCNRTEHTETAELTDDQKSTVLQEYRTEVEEKILKITEAAAVKVAQADARAEVAEATSNDAKSMLEYFADETVELAINKGLKEATNRDAYKEELRSLGFRGIKALREAYSVAPSKKDEDRKNLEESAKARFTQANLGRENDNKSQGRIGGFAAPIGPASTR